MATQRVSIGAAVGLRNGVQPMPNRNIDLATISDLLDRIPTASGGTADSPGAWPIDRDSLISEIAGQINTFQTTNDMASADSVVDPGGGTLRLMNQLAADPPLGARVYDPGGGLLVDNVASVPFFAAVSSMPGRAPLIPMSQPTVYSRRLVAVTGTSIKWFGVLVPASVVLTIGSASPHLFFTPTPIQGGYTDGNYDSFAGWTKLWDDYTDRIGGLISAAGVNQVLVIPFYKTSQGYNLGSFCDDWSDVVSAVVTAAMNDINPYALRDTFVFSSIYTSSFSNGVNAHRSFQTRGVGTDNMTARIFDLDGVAQTGGSTWRPAKGIIYQNRPSPSGDNPMGSSWYVGGRWANFDAVVPNVSTRYSHWACSAYLLYHGLTLFSS
ncbi:hypothetical protein GCM10007874_48350 [Labrys miyagiensis]|uniref:Uncharacterized protein n=1 Tax=Labrys miyagiensis TaxID=346912 RepID=A0ABQ6CPV7_9HYPH|nr:hypothetical protein [Labrys miyagiensis]GLS21818.1 hypothetical protein GCM10007874_48350 [Labrys miyagiensis]